MSNTGTTIRISKDTADRLRRLMAYPNLDYDAVINSLLDEHEVPPAGVSE